MSDDFVDKVIHDTVIRNVRSQFQQELALSRRRAEVAGEILAVHGLASALITVPSLGSCLVIAIEKLSPAQLDGLREIITAVPPPMTDVDAEAIAFDGMEEEDGELRQDD